MSVIVVLIALSLIVAAGFLIAFFWAVRSGQYNDTYTPAIRMLFEDKDAPVVSSQRGEGRDSGADKEKNNTEEK
ncbi:MAG: cbb3-type cytochrome oxidase assembly protein CcoS [Ignavibacteriaceae bacterium]